MTADGEQESLMISPLLSERKCDPADCIIKSYYSIYPLGVLVIVQITFSEGNLTIKYLDA